jgi:hypothetical protein
MNVLKGITFTVFSSLVSALIFAFIFRLPIPMLGIIGPFGEYDSGSDIIEIFKMVFLAWVFYGILGGFIILSVFGGLAGHLVGKTTDTLKNTNIKILKYSFIAGLIPVLFISTLDFFIGSW